MKQLDQSLVEIKMLKASEKIKSQMRVGKGTSIIQQSHQ